MDVGPEASVRREIRRLQERTELLQETLELIERDLDGPKNWPRVREHLERVDSDAESIQEYVTWAADHIPESQNDS